MSEDRDIDAMIASVERLLAEKFALPRRNLDHMLRKTGRRLPRRLQAQGRLLWEARERARHPKLARQLDWAALEKAQRQLVAHLEAIDVAERRKNALLRLAGVVVFNLLLVFAATVFWIWWRGLI